MSTTRTRTSTATRIEAVPADHDALITAAESALRNLRAVAEAAGRMAAEVARNADAALLNSAVADEDNESDLLADALRLAERAAAVNRWAAEAAVLTATLRARDEAWP